MGGVMIIGPGNPGIVEKGQLRLTAPETTNLAIADQWYPIEGTFADGNPRNFELDTDTGELTHTGFDDRTFLLNGTSDLSSDKVAKVSYALFVNDTLVPDAVTPHDFPNAASTQNIAITGIVTLNKDDVCQVRAKSNTTNTTITVNTLRVALWGER